MLTIDISATEIRLMEVEGGRITAWASSPLGPDAFHEGVIADPSAVGAAIKKLLVSNRVKGKNVTAGVSGLYSLSRLVSVPVASRQLLTEHAVREATEAVMPLSADELYFSWRPVEGGEANQQQVLVIGVPRDVIDSEIRALKAAGVRPGVMELKTLALARAVNRQDALVLNIDAANFDVVITAGGSAEVLRTTAWQPHGLGVDEQAEQLISAVELTVGYFNSHHPGSPLPPTTPLLITGQLSGDSELVRRIEDGVENPVQPLAPALEHPQEMPVAEYAANIGLALKRPATPALRLRLSLPGRKNAGGSGPATSSLPDINFLPRAYEPWRPSARQIAYSLGLVAAIVLVFPLYDITTKAMHDTSVVKQRYAGVNAAMERRKDELAKRQPIQADIDRYNAILAMGGGVVSEMQSVMSIAKQFNMTTTTITDGGGAISFSCEAPDYTVFREFVSALETSGRFSSVVIPTEGFPYVRGGPITLKVKR